MRNAVKLGSLRSRFFNCFRNCIGNTWTEESTILSKVLAAECERFGPGSELAFNRYY